MKRPFAWPATAAVTLILALVLGGCGASRNDLGTSATACYRALPSALNAVGRRGHLVGVRRRSRNECVIALRGPYSPTEVATATIKGSRYAVITVNIEHTPGVMGVLLTDHLPCASITADWSLLAPGSDRKGNLNVDGRVGQ